MKTIIILPLLMGLSTAALAVKPVQGKHHEIETISEVIEFVERYPNHQVRIFNVNGSIDVAGHVGDDLVIEASKQISAENTEAVIEGLDEIDLTVSAHDQTLYIYLDSPFTHFDPKAGELWHSDTCWRRDDCSRKHPKKDYHYRMDIMIQLPESVNLEVSTINQGDITITGVHAEKLTVSNINGAIDMADVSGQSFVSAINQDINIAYRDNPIADSKYESINGDLNITFAGTPDAEVVYDTMHGDFYTAYDITMLPAVVKRSSKQKKHGIQYKLDAENRLQVGQGGPEYRFKTLNGDIKMK